MMGTKDFCLKISSETLKFPYEHAKLFSVSYESSIVIAHQLRELACNWPVAKYLKLPSCS